MAMDINVNNGFNINTDTGAQAKPAIKDAVSEAAKKAVEAMGDVTAKEQIGTKPEDPGKPEDNEAAISAVSEQGDRLNVTRNGADSARVGGTVLENGEDGLVAEQNKVSIEANRDAMESMRAQIEETRENQAKAMEKMRETAEANAERARERNELRDADNADASARKDVIIEEASRENNSVVETAKEHVDNLSGLTENQVEQLYRDGRISRYEYEQNMETREAQNETAEAAIQENAAMVQETLAGEAVAAASEALVTAADNGNSAVMEAALGINEPEPARVQAVMS